MENRAEFSERVKRDVQDILMRKNIPITDALDWANEIHQTLLKGKAEWSEENILDVLKQVEEEKINAGQGGADLYDFAQALHQKFSPPISKEWSEGAAADLIEEFLSKQKIAFHIDRDKNYEKCLLLSKTLHQKFSPLEWDREILIEIIKKYHDCCGGDHFTIYPKYKTPVQLADAIIEQMKGDRP